MRRILTFAAVCFAALHLSAAVTIDARDLKLYESLAGFPFYILRMEAAGATAQIRIEIHATAEDYTGTYSIDADNSALVLPAGASASGATPAASGEIVLSRPDGDLLVTGSITCTNGVTYELNLRNDPVANRKETITLTDVTLEDRILSEREFQLYGSNADKSLYIQMTVFSDLLEGSYSTRDIYYDYSHVRTGKTYAEYVYFPVLSGNLTVSKSDATHVSVTGTIICQNENDPYDLVEYTLTLTCLRDKKDAVMNGDATEADFEAYFPTYTEDNSEQAINGDIFVYARNADGACVALDIYIADFETEITPGTYPVVPGTDLANPYMTVHASEGIIAGFVTPSYAGYLNDSDEPALPVWYIMGGMVTVDADGRIEVNAVNSADRTIHCILGGDAPEGLNEQGKKNIKNVQKVLKNGQMLIIQGDRKFTILGEQSY